MVGLIAAGLIGIATSAFKKFTDSAFNVGEHAFKDYISHSNRLAFAGPYANTAFQYARGLEINKYGWTKEGMLKAGFNPAMLTAGVSAGWHRN